MQSSIKYTEEKKLIFFMSLKWLPAMKYTKAHLNINVGWYVVVVADSSAATETGVIIAHGIFIISVDECEKSKIWAKLAHRKACPNVLYQFWFLINRDN